MPFDPLLLLTLPLALALGLFWLHWRSTFRGDDFQLGKARSAAVDVMLRQKVWPRRDAVDLSAVVPREVQAGLVFRVEAVLARPAQIDAAVARLVGQRGTVTAGPARSLFARLARGSRIEFTLECAQAQTITPPLQSIEWHGDPAAVAFQITPNEPLRGSMLLVDINLFFDRVCIGHLPLELPIVAAADIVPQRCAAVYRRPERVFMSYTEDDRAEVMAVARALRRFDIEPFMDRLSIEGGEDWESRIELEIEACDTFMLFWSPAASGSTWVVREAARALALNQASSVRRPKIMTHLLGAPPPARPPAGLERLHFNDPLYALYELSLRAPA